MSDTINGIHRRSLVEFKYEDIDLIESRCKEKDCKQSQFHIGCPNCVVSTVKTLKCYFKNKLEYLKLQTFNYKSHFKKPCFYCSSSFKFEDGHFNLQKNFKVGKECDDCQSHLRNASLSKTPYQCAVCQPSPLSDEPDTFEYTVGKKFKCDLCNKSISTKTNLNRHKRMHMEHTFQCNYCPKQYKTKHSLDIHIFEHTGHKKFKCDFCSKTFPKKYILNRHKRVHMEISFQCKYCPREFKTKKYLDLHIFEHTGDKKFKCEFCGKTFPKQYLLNRHKRVHMEISFQCKYCPKEYKTKQYLDLHILEHNGDKFKCELCDKTFATEYKLKRHKAVHMKISFQCKYCAKEYKTKQYLDLHILEEHNGGKFKCELCGKTFTTKYKLKRHKAVHMKISFQCKYCAKQYKTKSGLNIHLFEHN